MNSKAVSFQFTAHLLDWVALHAAAPPWRDSANPYHIGLSEIMLQQTQFGTIGAHYDRFPTIAAPLDEVLKT